MDFFLLEIGGVRAEWWALISHPFECRRCKGGQTSSGIHPVSRMVPARGLLLRAKDLIVRRQLRVTVAVEAGEDVGAGIAEAF